MHRTSSRVLLIVAAFVLFLVPVVAIAAGGFADVDDGSVFRADIAWLADAGVTKGCNPPVNDEFCPESNVTREQMAAFMHRLAVNKVVDAKTAATATNADKLDGKDSTAFATSGHDHDTAYLAKTDKAADADKLDGKDSSEFALATLEVDGHFSCAGTSHVPASNATMWGWSASMLYHAGGPDLFRCNLDIPSGATVTSVRWSVRDNDNTQRVKCSMWRTDMVTDIGSETQMAFADTGYVEMPDYVQIDDTSIDTPTIDQMTYSYFAQCSLGAIGTSTGLYGVTVAYDHNPNLASGPDAEPGAESAGGSTD